MYKTYLYLPDNLKHEVEMTARIKRQPKAAVIRDAVSIGLKALRKDSPTAGQGLLDLAAAAKKIPGQLPKDLSEKHNEYTWD